MSESATNLCDRLDQKFKVRWQAGQAAAYGPSAHLFDRTSYSSGNSLRRNDLALQRLTGVMRCNICQTFVVEC